MQRDMLGRGEAISAGEALMKLLSLPLCTTSFEEITLEESYGRTLFDDIVSPEDMPEFPRSTMDGYALKASDTFGSSEMVPSYLKQVGNVRMGEKPGITVRSGEAVSIPTGGMVPEGADAVIMYEHVQRSGSDIIEVLRSVAPGENIVQAGEDIKMGQTVMKRSHVLRPQDVAALAGLGFLKVKVFKKPVVGIVSTGDEIVPHETRPQLGQVRDVNSFNLVGLVAACGGVSRNYGIIHDTYDVLSNMIGKAVDECEMVLISGGSSVGTQDMTADVIESMETGGVIFHGVAIKPGKPLIGGYVKNTPVFGLPGHPAAVSISFMNFVEPILKRIGGVTIEIKKGLKYIIEAILTKNVSSAPGREDHIRVALIHKDGELYAEPIVGKSGLISTLVRADGITVVPENTQGIVEGEKVKVRLF